MFCTDPISTAEETAIRKENKKTREGTDFFSKLTCAVPFLRQLADLFILIVKVTLGHSYQDFIFFIYSLI